MKAMNTSRLAATAVAATLLGLAATPPAQAQFAAHVALQIQAITPLCSEHPDYGVIGRVAGYYATTPRSKRLAWVGCFPDFAQCEAWRREALRPLNPPIQQNRCEERY